MTEPTPLNRPVGGLDPVSAPKLGAPEKDARGGVEFQAMLERLEERARELSASSNDALKPEELAGAVDRARESLEDVLSLKEQLLEAYRQAQSQRPHSGDAE